MIQTLWEQFAVNIHIKTVVGNTFNGKNRENENCRYNTRELDLRMKRSVHDITVIGFGP